MDFRELAFNNFYEYYISNNSSKEQLIDDQNSLSENQSIRYKQLILYTLDNLDTITLFVSDSSNNWAFERIKSVEKTSLPYDRGSRHLIRIISKGSCPPKYPRGIGVPAKKPLGS